MSRREDESDPPKEQQAIVFLVYLPALAILLQEIALPVTPPPLSSSNLFPEENSSQTIALYLGMGVQSL